MRLVSYWPQWVAVVGGLCAYYALVLRARRYGLDVIEYLKMLCHRTPN